MSHLPKLSKEQYKAAMQPYWDRLSWNWRHLLDQDANPYVAAGEGDAKPKTRTGREDLFHSIKNIWKESRRLRGHSKWVE